MNEAPIQGVVSTIAAKCKRCYNCVRSCPAKAIRVQGGQACVLPERCIGCGNCIRVCAQKAKQVQSAVADVEALLGLSAGPSQIGSVASVAVANEEEDVNSGGPAPRLGSCAESGETSSGTSAPEEARRPVVAILAPSYPAAFPSLEAEQVVAGVRALGFLRVWEVGFGAELTAAAYQRLLAERPEGTIISTPCPALVAYIEKHMPALVPMLAPIVSPMIALARAIKQRLLPGAAIVFIGPCIAKKAERLDPPVAGVVEAVLTYQGLKELWEKHGIEPAALPPSLPDEPWPYLGGVFPISGGLLKTAGLAADVLDDDILTVEGPDRCLAALREIAQGVIRPRFVDALFCEGCIGGPAYDEPSSVLARKERVTTHVRRLQAAASQTQDWLAQLKDLDLSRTFTPRPLPTAQPTEAEIRDILAKTGKLSPADELNCGACGYSTCREKALAVYQGLAEPEMCLPYLIEQLELNLERIQKSQEELARTREAALRAQQLASMGELAAEIAQQMSHPLGRLVLFAQMLRDTLPEEDPRRDVVAYVMAEAVQAQEVLARLQGFGRPKEPEWAETELVTIAERALEQLGPRLQAAGILVERHFADALPPLLADPAQLTQVLINILTNSIEALEGLGRGGKISLSARTVQEGRWIELAIHDTGPGLAPEVRERLFQPFVTTKRERHGVGLGLAVAHGIMRAHGGEIWLESGPGRGTTVRLRLPVAASPKHEGTGYKVMIVDDDPDFLEQHRLILEQAGFQVVAAERSDEALELAHREIPDAFLLDMMMERTDSGARLARALRRDPRFRRSPIVILTSVGQEMGFEFQRNPQAVLDWMKADAWFDKPVPIRKLIACLQELLQAARTPEGDLPRSPTGNGNSVAENS